MGNTVADTQSVLDKLVAGINTRKAQKGAKLTPTRSETVVAAPNPLAGFLPAFPYDDPQTMLNALRVARVELVHVLEGIDKLLVSFGGAIEGEPVPDPAAGRKATEKAADETDFARRFAAQQAEAQAAAYRTAGEVPVNEDGETKLTTKAERIAALKTQLEELG